LTDCQQIPQRRACACVRRSLHMSGPEHDVFLSFFSEDAELGNDELFALEDDDLLAMEFLDDLLATEGLEAFVCDEALLELLAEEGLDGVELLAFLRARRPRGQHAPVCGVGSPHTCVCGVSSEEVDPLDDFVCVSDLTTPHVDPHTW
jgi:hypothetical protein